jgi:Fe-S cluster assembly iron-binding protein IscA
MSRRKFLFTFTSAAMQEVHQSENNSAVLKMATRAAVRIHPHRSLQYGIGLVKPKDADLKFDLDGVSVFNSGAYSRTGRLH